MVDTVAPPHRLTFDDVLRMVEAGILDEDDRVELVDGVLVDMSPISPEHSGAVAWLNQHFAGANAGRGRCAPRTSSSCATASRSSSPT